MEVLLHEGWEVTATSGAVPEELEGRAVPATVPGCVTTDLLAAGLVPDPYLDENERLLAWIGRTNWLFTATFDAEALAEGQRCDLVCQGLDTVATVRLNGKVLGTTANMHRSYRFDTRPAIAAGPNRLEVEFEAPVDAAERMSRQLGPRPHNSEHPFNSIRKMACNFGWDWGPVLPTAGIWRPIGLDRWSGARIASVRPLVSVALPEPAPGGTEAPWADGGAPRRADATVDFHVSLERDPRASLPLRLTATVAGRSATVEVGPGQEEATVQVAVPDAELWWPAGYGGQPLYEATVELGPGPTGTAQGVRGRWEGRVGFRSIELDTRPDSRGRRLGFVVNGRSVLVRGANWIPDDCFPSRLTPERYRRRLERAVAAHANLLRVWGGGIYEDEAFYAAADELGIMVWQDFLLACAAYSEDEPLRSEFEAEAREAVARLSAHPSLAVWSGGNETIWLHDEWGWETQLQGRSWGLGYYLDLFPSVVAELDPTRPYMAGSPWSFTEGIPPNDANYGSMHVWDVWNAKDYLAYREHQPQFVAEFGFQGPPAWSTLARALTERPLSASSPALAWHQKAADGMGKLDRGLAAHFPSPRSFDEWHWAMSLNQARAITLAIEYWRSLVPRCRGTIVWQLNDCWPVISWAAIDGDGRLKPVWYALKKAYAHRLLTVQPVAAEGATRAAGGLAVIAVNDAAQAWDVTLEVTRRHFDGGILARATVPVSARPGHNHVVGLTPELWRPGDPAREVLVVSAPGYRAFWYFAEDKDLELPPPGLSAHVEEAEDGFAVVVQASSLQRDVALLADRLGPEAECDDMLFTLLPGESRRVQVRSRARPSTEELLAAGALRSANQLAREALGPGPGAAAGSGAAPAWPNIV